MEEAGGLDDLEEGTEYQEVVELHWLQPFAESLGVVLCHHKCSEETRD